MSLAPGTPVLGSSDPRTVEQNAAIARLSTTDGSIGSQYAGSLLTPDGTLTRDMSVLSIPPARASEINAILNAAGKLNADGKTVSGGYILALNVDGIPISYVGVSATNTQTQAQAASAALSAAGNTATGYTHRDAIAAAMRGVQTDGTPVDDPYLDLMQRWATAEGIPFTRPSAGTVSSLTTPVSAATVLKSGAGIASTQPQSTLPVQPASAGVNTSPAAPVSPVFTQGAFIPENFTPAEPFRTSVPLQVLRLPDTMMAASMETATPLPSDVAPDQAAHAATMTKIYWGAGILALIVVAFAVAKGK